MTETIDGEWRPLTDAEAREVVAQRMAPQWEHGMTRMTFAGTPGSQQQGPPVDGHDPGLCGNCGAELELDYRHQPIPHRCCTCRDTGRVRVTTRRADAEFGKPLPCPDCRFKPQRIAPEEPAVEAQRRLEMGLEPMYARARLDDFDRRRDNAAYLAAAAFVAKWPPEPHMLTFGSDTKGNGKTTLACAVLNEIAIRHKVYGRFASWPELLRRMRATQSITATETLDSVMAPYSDAPVLVLDDVGVGRQTEFVEEQMYAEVNRRYMRGMPLVITTNTWTALDDRVRSRLQDGSRGRTVFFEAGDYRPSLPAPKEANG